MKIYALAFAMLAASSAHSGITRVGVFDGQFREDFEDWNFLDNPSNFGGRFQVESGISSIRGFDNEHLTEANPLVNTTVPEAYGYAYSGKSLSVGTRFTRIKLLPIGVGQGGLRTLRFGGWFMLNDQTLNISFWDQSTSQLLGTDTISGSNELSYQWFGWEAQDVNFTYALMQHEGPRNQFSSFHVDDFTWDPVPEPASLLALAAGAGALLRKRLR